MAFTHSWQMLLLVRVFFGIGIGIKGATIPVYSAEVSPTVIRGALGESRVGLRQRVPCQKLTRLVMGWQLFTTVGIVLGFGEFSLWNAHDGSTADMLAANAILRNCGDITWRLQIGSSFIPAVPLALLIFLCESEFCPTDHRVTQQVPRALDGICARGECWMRTWRCAACGSTMFKLRVTL
jgi:MFS family permease